MNGNQLLLIFSMNVPPQDEEILRKVKSFFITDGEEAKKSLVSPVNL